MVGWFAWAAAGGAGVEGSEDDGREELGDPDAAEELHFNGVRGRELEDEEECAELDDEGDELGHGGFLTRGHGAAAELSPEVAGEEIGGGDGHDGGWDQCADGDGGEAEAGEPLREHFEKEEWDGEAGVFSDDAGGQGDVAEEGDGSQQEGVCGEHGGVAADDGGGFGAEDPGGDVGVEHKGDG